MSGKLRAQHERHGHGVPHARRRLSWRERVREREGLSEGGSASPMRGREGWGGREITNKFEICSHSELDSECEILRDSE
jgi:hypothetical protein